MANLAVVNATGSTVYLKATGAGSNGDPHIPEQAVTGPLTDTELRASAVAVSLSSAPLPTGAATAARQDTLLAAVDGIEAALAGTLTVDGAVTIGSALPAGSANIGDVDVASVSLPAAIYNGKTTVTTAGTRVALASSQALVSGVTVKALAANTGTIYVGNSSVAAANGFALAKGESVFLEIANLATVYLDSSVNGEGATFVAS